jgi:glucose-1-phosphate adenylyltransferase
MDYNGMIRSHAERGADLTVGCIPVPKADATRFGVMHTDQGQKVTQFFEKVPDPPTMPDDPTQCLASMGIYVFTAKVLFEMLFEDATRQDSRHDFGTDVIPPMIASHKVFAYRFEDRNKAVVPYWRDVGTIDAYYQANMDLISVAPVLNLYDREWPIRTNQPQLPPPKFVHSEQDRKGQALMSMVCQGCIVSGGLVRSSILSPNVRVNSYAQVESSLLFDGVDVGRYCRIRRAIVDKEVKIPQNTTIGHDLEHDRRRGFTVTEQGVVVIAKGELPESF